MLICQNLLFRRGRNFLPVAVKLHASYVDNSGNKTEDTHRASPFDSNERYRMYNCKNESISA